MTEESPTGRRPGRNAIALMLVGFGLLQVMWVFAVPPFRGIDEFDHAYRAAAVAHGEWVPSGEPLGRGTAVTVPGDIVAAAHEQCARQSYTTFHDCNPAERLPDGMVTVGSAAGRYNPLFYAVVGSAALPFEGGAALYAMRAASAALCLAMFALGLLVTRSWARGPWPFVALVVACTPVVVYSTAVAAPNALEILAGVTLATAGVGVVRRQERVPRWVVASAAAAAAVLVTLRSLGPLWCLLLLAALLIFAPNRRELVRALARRTDVRLGAGLVAVALLASVWWILAVRPLVAGTGSPPSAGFLEGLGMGAVSTPGWLVQSIAVFPYRTGLAPWFVYPSAFALFAILVVGALRSARPRERAALDLVMITALLLPIGLTALTYGSAGEVVWQGRYGLPFTLILVVLAGAVLDERSTRDLTDRRLVAAAVVLTALAQTPGAVRVLLNERAANTPAAIVDWVQPSPTLLVVLGALGSALLVVGAMRYPRRVTRDSEPVEEYA